MAETTQYCKAIVLQLKINIILKNTWIVLPFPHYLPNAVASQRDKALNNAAKSLQSCLTLCDPMDCSPPGSSVHGILQARILEWVAIPSPGDLPNPGIKPRSPSAPALQADSLPLSHWVAAAKSLQSCLTLCDSIDGSPPGSPVPGILQARTTGVGCHFLF